MRLTRKSKQKHGRILRMGCFSALGVSLLGGAWSSWQLSPPAKNGLPISVTIPARCGTLQVARILGDAGIVRNPWLFALYVRLRGDAPKLRPGKFRIPPNLNAGQVDEILKLGASSGNEISVTIPEGFTVAQIAKTLVEKHIIKSAPEFVKLARHPEGQIATRFPISDSGLEGFLFPDTYLFRPGENPSKIIQKMVNQFQIRFLAPNEAQIEHRSRNLYEIVTLASLIEREAETDADRPRIASVIENRLKKGMRLQIDATVLYALGHHKNRVFYKDLEVKSPYNTYRHLGLPPGPIASPGLPSLAAAMAPEKSNYLFYVLGPGKDHVFAATEAQHKVNVAAFKVRRKAAEAAQAN